jgi:hypothetical protein
VWWLWSWDFWFCEEAVEVSFCLSDCFMMNEVVFFLMFLGFDLGGDLKNERI